MRCSLPTCVAAVLVVGAGAATARAEEPSVAFGIRGGLNLATFHGDDVSFDGVEPKNRTGFCGGAFVAIPLGQSFLIQPEVLYSQKGAKYEEAGETFALKFDYVEVPLLFKARLGSGGAKPSLFAGPAVAFKIRSRLEADGEEEEEAEELKSTDFGIVAGVGLDLAAGSGSFVIDARYTWGLTRLDDSSDEADVKSGVWSFSVGYAF
jgi:hypothetical protein